MTPATSLTVIDGGLKEAPKAAEPEVSSVLTAWRAYLHAKLESEFIKERARRESLALIHSKGQELQRALLEAQLSDGEQLRDELSEIDAQLVSFLDATLGAVL